MDSSDAIQFMVVVVLIVLSAFFSSAETALTTINKIKIKSLADQGDKRAKTVLKIIEDSGRMLSALLIGNNIVNLSASSLITTLAAKIWGSTAIGVATGTLTLLILIFGEITPKTLATIHSQKMALAYSGSIYLIMKVMTPLIFIVNKLSMIFLKILRVDPNNKTDRMTEYELRTIVDVSHESGVIETEEKQMIYNVFDFGDSLAKDIMVPRVDMVFIDVNSSCEEILKVLQEEKFTRLPVYEDNTDNIIGVLNIKDLFFSNLSQDFDICSILREPYFTYEYKKTSELMMEMRQDSINFTIVLDEYGATSGLITLEDLLEEIVGEIRDEYDEDEEELIRMVNDHEVIVEGSMKLDDLNDALDLDFCSEEYDSIGGLIIEHLDHLPKTGESAILENGITLTVDNVTKNRIDKVHIYLPIAKKRSEEYSAEAQQD